MVWLKAIGGVVLGLVGLVWIAQGVNMLQGSPMTGQSQWAIIGIVLVVFAAWLLWSFARERGGPTAAD
jgi:hypothetical protein